MYLSIISNNGVNGKQQVEKQMSTGHTVVFEYYCNCLIINNM